MKIPTNVHMDRHYIGALILRETSIFALPERCVLILEAVQQNRTPDGFEKESLEEDIEELIGLGLLEND